MGRTCGGAHEISSIHAPLFLHGWVVGALMEWVGGWVGGSVVLGWWGGGVLVRVRWWGGCWWCGCVLGGWWCGVLVRDGVDGGGGRWSVWWWGLLE